MKKLKHDVIINAQVQIVIFLKICNLLKIVIF